MPNSIAWPLIAQRPEDKANERAALIGSRSQAIIAGSGIVVQAFDPFQADDGLLTFRTWATPLDRRVTCLLCVHGMVSSGKIGLGEKAQSIYFLLVLVLIWMG